MRFVRHLVARLHRRDIELVSWLMLLLLFISSTWLDILFVHCTSRLN